MRRGRRGIGVLGAAAVTGVAYHAGSSAAKSQAQDQAQSQQIADLEAQQAAQQQQAPPQYAQPPAQAYAAPPPQATPPAEAPSMDDKLAQLQKLSELQTAGILTQEEVAIQKARILAS